MPIRALVADDEELARQRIRHVLSGAHDFEVIGEAADGAEALRMIHEQAPDVVFLDIQMPELTGVEMLDSLALERSLPLVVFITAYNEFAIRAFELNAVDYVLKPFYFPRFEAALERIRARLGRRDVDEGAASLQSLAAALRRTGEYPSRVAVRQGQKIVVLEVKDIDYVESEANYLRLHVGAKSYLMRDTLKNLQCRLDPDRFVRVHRSVVVNTAQIREIEPLFHGAFSILLATGKRIESSSRYRETITSLFGEWR